MIAGAGRALITTVVTDASGIQNTQVTVINATTGNQTGATLTLTGRVRQPTGVERRRHPRPDR